MGKKQKKAAEKQALETHLEQLKADGYVCYLKETHIVVIGKRGMKWDGERYRPIE